MSTLQSASSLCRMTVTEQIANDSGAKGQNLSSGAFNRSAIVYTPAGTPPVAAYYGRKVVLNPASKELDLTGLLDTEGNAITATGKRVQVLRVYNPSAHAVTIGPAAVNGYEPFGAGKSVIVPAGSDLMFRNLDTLPEIGSTQRYLLLAGTAYEYVNLELLIG